jgi:putative Mn2+ efflux pump MntP
MPPIPPVPPIPPSCWHRREPIGAIVLIGLGVLFLLGQLDVFHGRLMEFSWPLLLIALGVWLVVRRIGESQGGPK